MVKSADFSVHCIFFINQNIKGNLHQCTFNVFSFYLSFYFLQERLKLFADILPNKRENYKISFNCRFCRRALLQTVASVLCRSILDICASLSLLGISETSSFYFKNLIMKNFAKMHLVWSVKIRGLQRIILLRKDNLRFALVNLAKSIFNRF